MKDASFQLSELLTANSGRALAISDSLRSRADFLLSFNPSGILQQDMESVLRGTGEHGVLTGFAVMNFRFVTSLLRFATIMRTNLRTCQGWTSHVVAKV